MVDSGIQVEREGAVAHVWLDRPDKHNAFDDHVAAELATAFADLSADDAVRAVVLAGRGKSFCAGGDLAWMRRVADYTRDENMADAAAFQAAFEAIDNCPHPVVGRLHGAAMGGGAGLVAVCDIVIASEAARLGFPEVRLGLVPGVISPYVLRKIGFSNTRHLFLTGERFGADEALRIGLVHRVVAADAIDDAVAAVVQDVLAGAPQGVRGAKQLVFEMDEATHTHQLELARRAIVDARASDDGREGTSAFLEKRKPRWRDGEA